MGSDLIGKKIHIEFYGLPGCGKSTVSELVAQKLESDGYTVIRASAETGNDVNPVFRKVVKLTRAALYYCKHPGIYKRVNSLVKRNGYTGFKERIIQLINVAQKLYHYSNSSHGIVYVWDEGLTQAAISLAVNGSITAKDNEETLIELIGVSFYQVHIYIKASIEVVMHRMENRSTNNSRVEKEKNTSKKINLLKKYEEACDFIDKTTIYIGDDRSANEIACDVEGHISKLMRGLS